MVIIAATDLLARSTTTTSVGWIGYIVIGVVGALIGGFLLSFIVDTAGGGWWFTLFTAVLGSVILLWVVGKVRASNVKR